jgi:hypothetical protein
VVPLHHDALNCVQSLAALLATEESASKGVGLQAGEAPGVSTDKGYERAPTGEMTIGGIYALYAMCSSNPEEVARLIRLRIDCIESDLTCEEIISIESDLLGPIIYTKE